MYGRIRFFGLKGNSRQGEGRMADKKKMIFNIVFLILVFAGTLYGVFHGEDLGKIVHIVKTVNHLFLYDAFAWNQSDKMDLFFIFVGRFFL